MSRDKLPEIKNLKAWIFKITSNICYTHLRRLMLERKVTGIITDQTEPVESDIVATLQAKALEEAVKEAVYLLPTQRKKIYQMSRDQGMTLAEICKELDLSMSTVKNTLTTSLQFIREHLDKKGYTISLFSLVLLSILKNN